MGACSKLHTPAALTPGKRSDTHFTETGRDLGPLLTGVKLWPSSGIRFPVRPAGSESLLCPGLHDTVSIPVNYMEYSPISEAIHGRTSKFPCPFMKIEDSLPCLH